MRTPDPLVAALRERRIEMGLRQVDVAEMLFMSRPNTLRGWETGRESPVLTSLRRLADALDCDIVLQPRRSYTVTDEAAGIRPVGKGKGRRSDAAEYEAVAAEVARLDRLRMPAWRIAEELGVSRRTVVRYRGLLRAKAA